MLASEELSDSDWLAIGVVGLLCSASLWVLAVGLRRCLSGRPMLDVVEREWPAVPRVAVVIVLLWLGLKFLLLSGTPSDQPMTQTKLVALLGDQALILMTILLPFIMTNARDVLDFGIRSGAWKQDFRLGGVGFLAAVLPVAALWMPTIPWRTLDNQHPLLQLLSTDRSIQTVLLVVLIAAVAAPIVEELMYRVVLQSWLQEIAPPREGLFAAAIVFSAVHGLPDAIPLFPLALVLGYFWQQRRSFVTNVVIHGLFNAANLALMLIQMPSE